MHFGESVICDVMQFLRAILTAGLFIAVRCQLFDKPFFEDGGSFNLTCDASRIGNVPAHVTEISELTIEKVRALNNSKRNLLIARYSVSPSEHRIEKEIPAENDWVIEESGGFFPTFLNNRKRMQVVLYVQDAKCLDEGLYICKAGFNSGVSEASLSDTITFKARVEEPWLMLTHHSHYSRHVSVNPMGQDVKLTCKLEGPAGLELTWLTGPNGGTNFVPYPIEGFEMVTPSPTGDPCQPSRYESTLSFKVLAVDTMYICMAKDGGVEAKRNNFTIISQISAVNEAALFGIMDSNWFVWNMLVMMVASLMWSRLV